MFKGRLVAHVLNVPCSHSCEHFSMRLDVAMSGGTARNSAQCHLVFDVTNISKDLRCLPDGIDFAQPSQKGQPGVGMSADAARMSACATMDSTRCQET